jgi:hypothetical protein
VIAKVYVDMFSIIAFILVTVIFFMLFSFGKGDVKEQINSASNIVSSNIVLLNYLRTPVVVDNINMTMSDLIVLWYYDKDKYDEIFSKNTEDILNFASYEYVDDKVFMIHSYKILIFDENKVMSIGEFEAKCFGAGQEVESFVPVSANTYLKLWLIPSDVKKSECGKKLDY